MRYYTPKPTQTTLILEKLLGGALPDKFVASVFYGLLQACGLIVSLTISFINLEFTTWANIIKLFKTFVKKLVFI